MDGEDETLANGHDSAAAAANYSSSSDDDGDDLHAPMAHGEKESKKRFATMSKPGETSKNRNLRKEEEMECLKEKGKEGSKLECAQEQE